MKNSKSNVNNTGLTGINYTKKGKRYKATVEVYTKNYYGKTTTKIIHNSTWKTLKRAKKARVNFIKSLL